MAEIYKYLDEYDVYEKDVLIERIVNYFDLSLFEAYNIYKNWKSEYMKPKIEIDLNLKGGWRIK